MLFMSSLAVNSKDLDGECVVISEGQGIELENTSSLFPVPYRISSP